MFKRVLKFSVAICICAAFFVGAVKTSAAGDLTDPTVWTGAAEDAGEVKAAEGGVEVASSHMGYAVESFTDDIFSFIYSTRLVGDDNPWPVVAIRYQDVAVPLWDGGATGYSFVISGGNVELQKYLSGAKLILDSKENTFFSGEKDVVTFQAFNEGESVRLILTANGNEVFNFVDAEEAIIEPGYFQVHAYSAPVLLEKLKVSKPLNATTGDIADPTCWSGSEDGAMQNAEKGVAIVASHMGYGKNSYLDEVFKFDYTTRLEGEDNPWPVVAIRYQDINVPLWDGGATGYSFVISGGNVELQKYLAGAKVILESKANTFFTGEKDPVSFQALNKEEGVCLILKVGDNEVFNFVDTEEPIFEAGYLQVHAYSAPVILENLFVETIAEEITEVPMEEPKVDEVVEEQKEIKSAVETTTNSEKIKTNPIWIVVIIVVAVAIGASVIIFFTKRRKK